MDKNIEQIKSTALDLFLKKGIDNVTCYEVAVISKVRFSVIEEYYPEKMDLVIAIYKATEADMFKHVYGELLEIEDFKVLMHKMFHQSIIWALNNPKEHSFMDYIQSQPYIWHSENELYPSVNQPLLEKVKKAKEDGIFKDLPIDFIIHFMMKILNACVSYIVALKTVTSEEYEELIDPMFESCWDALKK